MTYAVGDLRVRPAPASEPPYEDETHPTRDRPSSAPAPSRGVQGTLALSFALPSGAPATPYPPASLRIVRPSRDNAPDPGSGATQPPDSPWASRFVQALVEVLAGARPVTQLLHWTSPDVYERVRRRAAVPGGWVPNPNVRRQARLHSVRMSRPCGSSMEVCAVVRGGGRARAIALRFEETGGQWRCTQLELG